MPISQARLRLLKPEPFGGKSPQAKFARKHGEYIGHNGEFLFRDGAVLEATAFLPRMSNPPKDKWERAKITLRFWTAKEDRAKRKFQLCKATINGHTVLDGSGAYEFPEDVCVEDAERLENAAWAAYGRWERRRRGGIDPLPRASHNPNPVGHRRPLFISFRTAGWGRVRESNGCQIRQASQAGCTAAT